MNELLSSSRLRHDYKAYQKSSCGADTTFRHKYYAFWVVYRNSLKLFFSNFQHAVKSMKMFEYLIHRRHFRRDLS